MQESTTAAGNSASPANGLPRLPSGGGPLISASNTGKFAASDSLQSAWKELSADADAASRAPAPPQPQPQPPDTPPASMEAPHTQVDGASEAPATVGKLPAPKFRRPDPADAYRLQHQTDAPPQRATVSGGVPATAATLLHGDRLVDPQVEPAAPAAATDGSVAAALELAKGVTKETTSSVGDPAAAAGAASQPKARSRHGNLFMPRGTGPVAAGPQQIAVQLITGTPPVMVDAVPGMTAQQAEQQAAEQAGLTCMNPVKPELADIFPPWANPTSEQLSAMPGYESKVQPPYVASAFVPSAVCLAPASYCVIMHLCPFGRLPWAAVNSNTSCAQDAVTAFSAVSMFHGTLAF